MAAVLPLQPFPTFEDPNQSSVHSNATVTSSGSVVLTGYGASEVSLFLNVKAAPTGGSPTLQYTIQEVDPGDGTTVIGPTATSTVITGVTIERITLESAFGGSIKVSWTVGGTTPSFTQVYATLVAKQASAKITDGTYTAVIKPSSTSPTVADPALVVSVSPNSIFDPSVGTNNTTIPSSSTQVGGSDGTNLQAVRVFDADSGGGTQYVLGVSLRKSASGGSVELGTGTDPVRIDPTGTTSQPVTDAGGSLTVDTTQLPAALVGGRLDSNVGSWFGSTAPTVGQKAMANSVPVVLSSDQSSIPVVGTKSNNGGVPGTTNVGTLPAVSTAASPTYTEGNQVALSTLLTGALRSDVSSWFGSTSPTVGQKVMASSIPVTLASDQTAIPVTLSAAGAREGISAGSVVLGGGTANVLQVMRATAYTEPTTAAQRSIASSNANDTAAGTGARTVQITYFDNTGAGPLTEIVTLNGLTPVNTTNTNIRFIEKMEVLTAGTGGANAGTITLYGATGGGGGTVGTIGVGNISPGVGDNTTHWAHHYVATGYVADLSVLVTGVISGGSATNAKFFLKAIQPLVANATERVVGDTPLVIGTFERIFDFQPSVSGFSRITAYGIPGTNNATMTVSFDWSETAA